MTSRKLYFTELRVNGKTVPFDGYRLTTLNFEHNDDIELFVSTLDYVHAAPLKFAYKLEEFDDVQTVYTNMKPEE